MVSPPFRKPVTSLVTPMDREYLRSPVWVQEVLPTLHRERAGTLDQVWKSFRPRKIPLLGGIVKSVEMMHHDGLLTMFDHKGSF